MKRSSVVCSLIFSFLLSLGCARSSSLTIELVVADDYTGMILIRSSASATNAGQFSSDILRIEIGEDGSASLKTVAPFSQWHVLRSKYRSGNPLPVVDGRNQIHGGIVALRRIPYSPENSVRFFVGTESAAKQAVRKEFYPDDPPRKQGGRL
jgi:hypothetical protein